jgi:ABC-type polysaccharide/polyol phosphate export permease
MQACFFLTPIVYPAEHAPDFIARFLPMNPFYIMVELIRQPVYGAVSPSAPVIYSALGLAAVSLMGGFCILKSLDNRILFKL